MNAHDLVYLLAGALLAHLFHFGLHALLHSQRGVDALAWGDRVLGVPAGTLEAKEPMAEAEIDRIVDAMLMRYESRRLRKKTEPRP